MKEKGYILNVLGDYGWEVEVWKAKAEFARAENKRLREALEVIVKPSIGWDGSSNEMRQIARAALAQAAEKEGEWRKIK